MITTNTGAKKIEGTDNWRLIFDAHNDSVDAHSQAIQQIATVITGTTNNCGHSISSGEYFIANGAKYKASATIGTGVTWADKATSVSDHDLINALNGNLTWKNASSYSNAYSNAISEIALVGKGTVGSDTICIVLIIPKIAITSSNTVFAISDSYNGGTDYHLQATATTSSAWNIGLFAGADRIANESLQWMYR